MTLGIRLTTMYTVSVATAILDNGIRLVYERDEVFLKFSNSMKLLAC